MDTIWRRSLKEASVGYKDPWLSLLEQGEDGKALGWESKEGKTSAQMLE